MLQQQSSKLSKTVQINNNSATTDFISRLPDEILHSILSHLTLRDCVRTSVLSRRWKHVSSSLPAVKFDWLNMFPVQEDRFFEHPCINDNEDFVSRVDQYLEFYTGTSCLNSFEVSFCFSNGFTEVIDRWASFAIRMGVEHLYLELFCELYQHIPVEDANIKYTLRSELFEAEMSKLKHLHLVGCRLGVNFTTQFSSLETLELVSSPLALYDLQAMFSYMGKLSFLVLRNCSLPVKLCLGSLHILKKFSIITCVGINEIEFCNANLLFLECNFNMITFSLSGVPNLKELHYSVDSNGNPNIFVQVPRKLPMLQTLMVHSRTDLGKNIPKNITTLSNLKDLKLVFSTHLSFDISNMISILKAFPNLRRFSLVMISQEDGEEGKPLPNEYVHKHLEYVEIAGFDLDGNSETYQIEFAKYLLEHAPSLKQLVLYNVKWSEGEHQMVYDRLQELSKNVKLIFK